jgi:CheY-like chemotaxis protein
MAISLSETFTMHAASLPPFGADPDKNYRLDSQPFIL